MYEDLFSMKAFWGAPAPQGKMRKITSSTLRYNNFFLVQVRCMIAYLLPTGSEEREVFGVGSIPVAIHPSCQYMINIVL